MALRRWGAGDMLRAVSTTWRSFASSAAAAETADKAKRPRGKPKNLFELAALQPKNGIGSKFYRKQWARFDNCFYTVTRIVPSPDGKHGKAWGQLTWWGRQVDGEGKILGPLKKEWKVLPGDSKFEWKSLPIPAKIASLGDATSSVDEEEQREVAAGNS